MVSLETPLLNCAHAENQLLRDGQAIQTLE